MWMDRIWYVPIISRIFGFLTQSCTLIELPITCENTYRTKQTRVAGNGHYPQTKQANLGLAVFDIRNARFADG